MVFVVGCLAVIAVLLYWGYSQAPLHNKGTQFKSGQAATAASQKAPDPLQVKVKTKTPQRQIGKWEGEYNYSDLNRLSGVKANYGGYEGPSLEQVINVPNQGYSKVLCYDAEGKSPWSWTPKTQAITS